MNRMTASHFDSDMASRKRSATIAGWVAVCVAVVGMCGCDQPSVAPTDPLPVQSPSPSRPEQRARILSVTLSSTAFDAGQTIPRKQTADGKDVSPQLHWSNLPDGTKELALIVDDPDAPSDEPWVHWVIYNIPAAESGLPESIPNSPTLSSAPAGANQGENSWGTTGYRGPAPPAGHGVHHYHFKLYALDASLPLKPGLIKEELLKAMAGHILAEGELVGIYQR